MVNKDDQFGVLLSIHREWAEFILNGEKTLEIRKTPPRMVIKLRRALPVYLYETLSNGGKGAVIGKCMCKGWIPVWLENNQPTVPAGSIDSILQASCLTKQQLVDYLGKSKKAYAWMIAQPERFEQPIPLTKFGFKRAPQSWAYLGQLCSQHLKLQQ